jgi:hypothetical protein
MKNPPTGGFFIAAKFPNQEVRGKWPAKKRRSSNHRASGNEEPADRRVFIAREFPTTNKKARHQTGFFVLWLEYQAA